MQAGKGSLAWDASNSHGLNRVNGPTTSRWCAEEVRRHKTQSEESQLLSESTSAPSSVSATLEDALEPVETLLVEDELQALGASFLETLDASGTAIISQVRPSHVSAACIPVLWTGRMYIYICTYLHANTGVTEGLQIVGHYMT